MTEDLRENAAYTIGLLRDMRRWFPPKSPGRLAIKDAIRKLEIAYILGHPHKLQMILAAIDDGNRRFTDLLYVTGLPKLELEDLLKDLIEAGYLRESLEKPFSIDGRGRPARIYEKPDNK